MSLCILPSQASLNRGPCQTGSFHKHRPPMAAVSLAAVRAYSVHSLYRATGWLLVKLPASLSTSASYTAPYSVSPPWLMLIGDWTISGLWTYFTYLRHIDHIKCLLFTLKSQFEDRTAASLRKPRKKSFHFIVSQIFHSSRPTLQHPLFVETRVLLHYKEAFRNTEKAQHRGVKAFRSFVFLWIYWKLNIDVFEVALA